MIMLKLFITFLKVGLFTIGSGYSMLVLAQRYIVENYKWLTLEEFTDVVAIAEVTPGPIMINLATFVGSRVGGLKGSICATTGLVFIPFLCLYIISINYDKVKEHEVLQRIMRVARPMAVGFITVAILNLFKRSITDMKTALVAVIVIVLTAVFRVNPIFTVMGVIIAGIFVKL